MSIRLFTAAIAALTFLVFAMAENAPSQSPGRDINAVLAAHDKELLAVPGVTGVYVGVLDDGKTPCLKVMLARPSSEANKIPKRLEGYPVITEVTGPIRPLGSP